MFSLLRQQTAVFLFLCWFLRVKKFPKTPSRTEKVFYSIQYVHAARRRACFPQPHHLLKNKHVTHFHPDTIRRDSNTFHQSEAESPFSAKKKNLQDLCLLEGVEGHMRKHVISYHKAQVPDAIN